eukprot:Pgem_evm1s16594
MIEKIKTQTQINLNSPDNLYVLSLVLNEEKLNLSFKNAVKLSIENQNSELSLGLLNWLESQPFALPRETLMKLCFDTVYYLDKLDNNHSTTNIIKNDA